MIEKFQPIHLNAKQEKLALCFSFFFNDLHLPLQLLHTPPL
jgi:hypothetical protein